MPLSPDAFRRLALALPETAEVGHMGHPDFRVRGKIFATLGWPDAGWGVLMLTLDQRDAVVETAPRLFQPVAGGWGKRGATTVRLAAATARAVRPALELAWGNVAPASLARAGGEGAPARARSRRPGSGDAPTALVRRLLLALPGVEEGRSYGTPGFRVKGKLLARLLPDGETLAVICGEDERDFRLQSDPAVFFTTDHYRGYPTVLVRLAKVARRDLEVLLERAWRRRAPARLVRASDGGE